MGMRRTMRLLAAAALCTTLAAGGLAQAQPGRPLTLVVPSGAGSAPDIIARLLGDELRVRLDQPLVVENKAGAGGIIAAMAVKTAKPDGNTLLMTHAAVVTITPLTYRAAVYDVERDFEPIVAVTQTPMMIVANAAGGPATLAELLASARSRPDAVAVGSTMRGTIPHLSMELLAQAAGVRFNMVPMSGTAQAITALSAGDTLASADGISPLLPLVRAGRFRALAVTSDRVLPGLEGLPLAKDTVPGLVTTGWFMLFAPKGTPAARRQALNAAVNAALQSPELVHKLRPTANYPLGGSIADARAFLASETKLWSGAVRRAGLPRE